MFCPSQLTILSDETDDWSTTVKIGSDSVKNEVIVNENDEEERACNEKTKLQKILPQIFSIEELTYEEI